MIEQVTLFNLYFEGRVEGVVQHYLVTLVILVSTSRKNSTRLLLSCFYYPFSAEMKNRYVANMGTAVERSCQTLRKVSLGKYAYLLQSNKSLLMDHGTNHTRGENTGVSP